LAVKLPQIISETIAILEQQLLFGSEFGDGFLLDLLAAHLLVWTLA